MIAVAALFAAGLQAAVSCAELARPIAERGQRASAAARRR